MKLALGVLRWKLVPCLKPNLFYDRLPDFERGPDLEKLAFPLRWMVSEGYERDRVVEAIADPQPYVQLFKEASTEFAV